MYLKRKKSKPEFSLGIIIFLFGVYFTGLFPISIQTVAKQFQNQTGWVVPAVGYFLIAVGICLFLTGFTKFTSKLQKAELMKEPGVVGTATDEKGFVTPIYLVKN